ncbi:MAG TPA: ABC transporter substrate-binding protein [Aggregatilinea sp.]|jgi:peptide/nickel transport system substrate-binding protein|uniref:ABC transporter substrate-binding protein n=2 Tax=Aggregatilinea sp. TaxID=2806333 RepID=UPI002CC2E51C|nr:ABC transporter substrate-binding protein [Aggregatilinea sp.]HML25030.1 ABC transporter substrate-binding protein [Aggregatilinea sp.]
MKVSRFVLAIALVVMVLGAALPAMAQGDGNVLIVARAADTTGLDPHTQTAFASLRLLELIYEPLVMLDADLNVVPALAESWDFSDDATQLTFNLRQGVTFHDGSDFTSEDVKASLERILNEETGAATRANLLSIASIDTPDDYTVVLNLSEPDVPLLAALATTNAVILSSDVIANGDPATETIGTGPFMLDSWVPEETTTLTANPNWWGDGPYVDGIEMRVIPDEASILAALRAGTVDFALLNDPLVATLLIDDPDVVLNRAPSIAYHVLQLNAANPPLDKLEVRQAISCAIDRQEVLDTAALGEGSVTGPVTSPAYEVPLDEFFCYERDVEKAKELMIAAGMEDGFSLTIMAASAEPPTAMAEAQTIQSQLADINIDVEIEPLELSVYVDRWLAADFDAAVALNGGRPDPYTMYARYFTANGNLATVAGYGDETLDQLMQEGRAETDPAARLDIFTQFQKHLVEMAPWIWLYTDYEYTAQQPYVQGFVPMPTDSIYSLAQVSIERE